MKDEDFQLLKGFAGRWTDAGTDICECRVDFATEKLCIYQLQLFYLRALCHPVVFHVPDSTIPNRHSQSDIPPDQRAQKYTHAEKWKIEIKTKGILEE